MGGIRYQPQIDGLRAVAVLLVIAHHLGDWAGMHGGYVGVDVFFVISGFLITSILKSELDSQRFTFGGFYRRRVIRLAPAYFTVVLVTTTVALFLMLPSELMVYGESMLASSVFLANFHMWKEVGGYFGANSDVTPLLHLWSLAVEEQFYLLWPMALLACHRMVGHKTILGLIVLLTAAGVLLSQWGVERFPAAAYYLLPTRFFELAVGATLAYLPAARAEDGPRTLMSAVGLGLVFYAAFAYGDETLFPGYAALFPVIGTAVLIRWSEGTLFGNLLGTPVMTAIGKVSYPAYLWHWPIIAFLNIQNVQIDAVVGLGVIGTTFLLSWLTYRMIELPARRFASLPARKVVFVGAALPIFASISAAFLLDAARGFPARFPEELNRKSEALLAFPNKLRGQCNEGPPTNPLPPDDCILGRPNGEVDFLLVGDSHANHFTGFMDELGKDANLRGYDMTRSNTPFLPGIDLALPNEPEYNKNFRPRNDFVTQHLSEVKYDTVVLAGAYTQFFGRNIFRYQGASDPAAFETGLREALRIASSSARRVLVFTQVPILPSRLHDCSLRAERSRQRLECRLPAQPHSDQVANLGQLYGRLASDYPKTIWINLDELLCDESWCLTEIDGIPLYKDGGHLNDQGSRLLARKWIQRFGNPLVQTPLDAVSIDAEPENAPDRKWPRCKPCPARPGRATATRARRAASRCTRASRRRRTNAGSWRNCAATSRARRSASGGCRSRRRARCVTHSRRRGRTARRTWSSNRSSSSPNWPRWSRRRGRISRASTASLPRTRTCEGNSPPRIAAKAAQRPPARRPTTARRTRNAAR